MKRSILTFVLIGFTWIIALLAGMEIEKNLKREPVAVSDKVETIAIVNLDQGIQLNNKFENFGTQLLNFTNKNFKNTSLEEARKGVTTGKFAAYIIIPVSFSERVWSINTYPEKSILEYALNPNLDDQLVPDVIYNLKSFEMQLNANISYIYLHSVMEEFHQGQAASQSIMSNDKKDLESLLAISPESLVLPVEFAELSPMVEYPSPFDFGDQYGIISLAVDDMGEQYREYLDRSELSLYNLVDEKSMITEATDTLESSLTGLNLMESRDGVPVYQEGKRLLLEGMDTRRGSIFEERLNMKNSFLWLGKHEFVATPSNAVGMRNTWLDEIGREAKRQQWEYHTRLMEWKESFDYSKLATPSVATPPNATPSDATPSDATPSNASWLVDRDLRVVKKTMEGSSESIEELLDDLDLEEDTLDELKTQIQLLLTDEESLRPRVEEAGRMYPVGANPEAGGYIRTFLNSVPNDQNTLDQCINRIKQAMTEYCQSQIEAIGNFIEVTGDWIEDIFEIHMLPDLESQEGYLQNFISEEVRRFADSSDEYQQKLEDYQTEDRIDTNRFDTMKGLISSGMRDVETSVNDKRTDDEEFIRQVEENKENDISLLQDHMDQASEGTMKNVTDALEEAKIKRAKIQQENKELLTDFTRKLPYTRNGSIAATDTYDFMINPVSVKEKILVGNSTLIRSQGIRLDQTIVMLGLLAVVAVLAVQNCQLRRKGRSTEE